MTSDDASWAGLSRGFACNEAMSAKCWSRMKSSCRSACCLHAAAKKRLTAPMWKPLTS